MVEIFGAAFALLLIFFLFINLFAEAQLRALTESGIEESLYKIDWERGAAGYIVLAFPDRIQIIENKEISFTTDIRESCSETNFFEYAQRVYENQQTQLIFAIVEGGVTTMKEARDCLRRMWPQRRVSIGWIIANSDFLKAVRLEELPERIRRSLDEEE